MTNKLNHEGVFSIKEAKHCVECDGLNDDLSCDDRCKNKMIINAKIEGMKIAKIQSLW